MTIVPIFNPKKRQKHQDTKCKLGPIIVRPNLLSTLETLGNQMDGSFRLCNVFPALI